MKQTEAIAAEFIASSAPAYAAMAANRLMETSPGLASSMGNHAFRYWKEHLQQRLLELSAALAESEPKLFTSQVKWSITAFQARDISPRILRQSLASLREVLSNELPESGQEEVASYIDLALEALDHADSDLANVANERPHEKLSIQYMVAVLDGESHRAIKLVTTAIENGLPVQEAYEHVLLAAQREVGAMWHRAEISISEEHFVTATTERAMAVICYKADRQPSNGQTIVSAAVAENVHDIGVRAVSDMFELAGWRAICLGGDAPDTDIADAAQCFEAELVLLSAALTTQLKAVRKTILAIRESAINCKVMVGGQAFRSAPEIWQQIGADGYASTLSGALQTGTELVQTSSST